jgi:hypothetical protein
VISGRTLRFSFGSAAFLVASLLGASPAFAQTRWDASLQAGASMRAFSGNTNVAGLTGNLGSGFMVSPMVGLEGDVAIVPLLRLGLYADYEYAETGEPKPPSIVSFGARAKLMLPGYRSNVHWWLFTGIGAAVLDAPAYTAQVQNPSALQSQQLTTESVPSATGVFAEIPLGVGLGWRLSKPLELVAELQGRFGFAMNGSYFSDDGSGNGLTRPATTANGTAQYGQPTGTDVIAIQLTVGVAFEGP